MTTLYAKNENRFGTKVTLFAAGTVTISTEGSFEVANEGIAKEVLETYPNDFSLDPKAEAPVSEVITETTTLAPPVEELKKKAEESEFGKTDTDELGGNKDNDDLIKSLTGKSITELKELAKPFPKAEWKDKKTAEELIAYLTAKINS